LPSFHTELGNYGANERLLMLATLLGFSQLISASLLKIDHIVIAHLIAGAMFSQNPTGELNA